MWTGCVWGIRVTRCHTTSYPKQLLLSRAGGGLGIGLQLYVQLEQSAMEAAALATSTRRSSLHAPAPEPPRSHHPTVLWSLPSFLRARPCAMPYGTARFDAAPCALRISTGPKCTPRKWRCHLFCFQSIKKNSNQHIKSLGLVLEHAYLRTYNS